MIEIELKRIANCLEYLVKILTNAGLAGAVEKTGAVAEEAPAPQVPGAPVPEAPEAPAPKRKSRDKPAPVPQPVPQPVPVGQPVPQPIAAAALTPPTDIFGGGEALPTGCQTGEDLRLLGQKIAQSFTGVPLQEFSAFVKEKICYVFMVPKLNMVPDIQVARAEKIMLDKATALGYVRS